MATAVVRAAGEGDKTWFYGGGLHTWKATAGETGGAFLLFEDQLGEGKVTPMHSHPDVDEALYVLEGEIVLNVEGEEHNVGAGGFTMVPRGVEHAFIVTSTTARLLCLQTPGTAEAFYRGASEPATDLTIPGPVDFDKIRAAAQETGATSIVGPPPFAKTEAVSPR